LMRVQI